MENDLTSILLINGRMAGTWKRTIGKRSMTVTLKPFRPLSEEHMAAVAAAAHRLGAFLGLPVTLA
jgi:hypothetical protein